MLAQHPYNRGRWLLLVALVLGCHNEPSFGPSDDGVITDARVAGILSPASNLAANAVSTSQLDLTWQDNTTNETGFEVHRSTSGASGLFHRLATTAANITGHSDLGLIAAQLYCYKVRAFKQSARKTTYTTFSATACATTQAPPPPGPNAPSGVVVTPTASDRVLVTWVDNSNDEEWFRPEKAPTSGGPWSSLNHLLGSGYTSHTVWGIPSEQQVCFRVIAFNDMGESAPSNVDCTAPPASPNALTGVSTDGPEIDLAWQDNSAVEDGYEVRRGSPSVQWATVAELPANTTSYRDAGVSGGTSYYYEVRATKDGGFSGSSNSVSIVAGGVLNPPARLSLQPPQGYYLGTMWLFWWNDPATVDSVQIERCNKETCADADFTLIATVSADVTSMAYQDWGLGDWTIYTYRIRATNQAGESEPSSPVQGRTCIEEVDWYSPCFPPLPGAAGSAPGSSSQKRKTFRGDR